MVTLQPRSQESDGVLVRVSTVMLRHHVQGTGEIPQGESTLSALPEDLSLIPNTHIPVTGISEGLFL